MILFRKTDSGKIELQACLYVLFKGEKKPKKLYVPTDAKWHFADGVVKVTIMGDLVTVISMENVVYVSDEPLRKR